MTNSRFQDAAAAGLTAADLAKLKLKWAFNLGDVTEARSQPAVIGRYVFIGATNGALYALDADSGCTLWGFRAASGIRGGAAIGEPHGTPAVFFADTGANVYALNAQTGKLIWKVRPVDHFAIAGNCHAPLSTRAWCTRHSLRSKRHSAAIPNTNAARFVAAWWPSMPLPARSCGKLSPFPMPPSPHARVPRARSKTARRERASGRPRRLMSKWTLSTSPQEITIRTRRPGPATRFWRWISRPASLLWSSSTHQNDAYNNACAMPIPGNCPATHGADYDFGQPPILVSLTAGQTSFGDRAKIRHGLCASIPTQKGKILWQTRVGKGGPLGGSQWGSASDGRRVYVAVSDLALGAVPDPKSTKGLRLDSGSQEGRRTATRWISRTGKIEWSAPATALRGVPNGLFACAIGRCYRHSRRGLLRFGRRPPARLFGNHRQSSVGYGHCARFSTVNGKPAHGGSMDAAGPAVVNGMIFVNSGYGQWGGMPGNVLLAFSVH